MLVPVFFCSVIFPLFFVLHQPVIRRLSGRLVRHPRHQQTAERRRCAGPLQCDVIDDTIKLLNDDAALLRLHHCGFGCRCQLCSQDTHWLHFSVFFSLSPIPRAALREERERGEEWLLSPEGIHHPRHHQAAGRQRSGLLGDDTAWLSLLQVWGVRTRSYRFSFLVFLFLQVGRRLLRRWCCAWAAAPGVFHRRSRVGELPRHTPQTHCSATPLVLVRDDLTTQVALRSSWSLIAVFLLCCSLCFFVSSVIRAP